MKERESKSCLNCKYNIDMKKIRQGSICWECSDESTPYDRYPYWEMDDMIFEYETLLEEEDEDDGLSSW